MPKQPTEPDGNPNRLLASLPPKDYRRLSRHFERVALAFKQSVFEQDRPIDYVYFPYHAVVSLLTKMRDGAAVEVGTVGNEGMVGVGVYLEAIHVHLRAMCQIPGDAVRIKAAAFRKEMARNGTLHRMMHRYAQALMVQFTQGLACNRLHTIEQRCARWLLLSQDRVGSDTFPLTQEFMGQMLGVRRASVTVIAGLLQEQGLIRYSRGRITVLDRHRLEQASCECYEVIRRETERLTGRRGSRQ